jgi:hypothetical protein
LALVLAGSLVGAAVALPALAATSTKFYTPSITSPSPLSSPAGATVSYTFKILNDLRSTQQLGSANITVPTGFAVVLGSVGTPKTFNADDSSSSKQWTGTASSSVVMLRNPGPGPTNRLNPGQYVTVKFDAIAPCQPGTSYGWTTRVKQSNDFSGTGNDFTRTGSDPTETVTGTCSTGAASITYVSGFAPSDTSAGGTMATVEAKVVDNTNNPVSGDAVALSSTPSGAVSGTLSATTDINGIATFSSVTVSTVVQQNVQLTATEGTNGHFVDAYFNITPGAPANVQFTVQPTDTLVNATISPAVEVTVTDTYGNGTPGIPVTMSIGAGPGNLSGGGPVNTVSGGVATFSGLSIDQSSSDYTLVATANALTQTSALFDITSFSVDCNGGLCRTDTPIISGTHSVSVNADGGIGTLSITFESQPPLGCPASGGVGASITLDPPQGSPAPPSITVTFDDTITGSLQNSYPVCKTVNEGPPENPVPFCENNPALPCVQEQEIQFHGTQPPTLHTVMLITQTDPKSYH